eukprot:COSAG02_NODE_1383_length_12965_cov_60.828463_12_plen_196_part_01
MASPKPSPSTPERVVTGSNEEDETEVEEHMMLLQHEKDDCSAERAGCHTRTGDGSSGSIYSSVSEAAAAAAKAARQNRRRGFVLCTLGGTLWGSGALFAKLMDNPTVGIAEYLVFRTGMISLWLFTISLSQSGSRSTLLRLRSDPWALGWPALIGGLCNAVGMACFVVSLSYVTAANTLCIQAAAPFSAAFLERLI